jgi:hypothetical protein
MRCRTTHLALLIFSELGQKLPSLAADLETQPLQQRKMASGEIAIDVPMVGAPAPVIGHRHPTEQGQMPPPARHRHWSGESLICVITCLGSLLCCDTDLCLLIGLGLLSQMR